MSESEKSDLVWRGSSGQGTTLKTGLTCKQILFSFSLQRKFEAAEGLVSNAIGGWSVCLWKSCGSVSLGTYRQKDLAGLKGLPCGLGEKHDAGGRKLAVSETFVTEGQTGTLYFHLCREVEKEQERRNHLKQASDFINTSFCGVWQVRTDYYLEVITRSHYCNWTLIFRKNFR